MIRKGQDGTRRREEIEQGRPSSAVYAGVKASSHVPQLRPPRGQKNKNKKKSNNERKRKKTHSSQAIIVFSSSSSYVVLHTRYNFSSSSASAPAATPTLAPPVPIRRDDARRPRPPRARLPAPDFFPVAVPVLDTGVANSEFDIEAVFFPPDAFALGFGFDTDTEREESEVGVRCAGAETVE